MARQLRYSGQFLSRSNVIWRVDILQERDTPFAEVGDLDFDADEAVVIEWEEQTVEGVVQGSTATLRVISPDDRTFEDLYTIEPATITTEIYREGELYWSGSLDPELYEEPYERLNGYSVALTFSDFGILDRTEFALRGTPTYSNIVAYALEAAGITYGSIETLTSVAHINDASFGGICVRADNFCDDDGVYDSVREVLEACLLALGMKMVQRSGKIYIYDLGGLYESGERREAIWSSDTQTLSAAEVANEIHVKLDINSEVEVMSDEAIEFTGAFSENAFYYVWQGLTSADNPNYTPNDATYGLFFTYFTGAPVSDFDASDWRASAHDIDRFYSAFNLFLSDTAAEGIAAKSANAKYFKMLPLGRNVTETSGVAWKIGDPWGYENEPVFHGRGFLADHNVEFFGNQALTTPTSALLLKTQKTFIPSVMLYAGRGMHTGGEYMLRLRLPILLDTRYNPFEEASSDDQTDYNEAKEYAGYIFLPFSITVYDAEGNALYHYTNSAYATKAASPSLHYAQGKWESGAGAFGDAWLSYYDPSDLEHGSSGVFGWKNNRHCVGRPEHISTYMQEPGYISQGYCRPWVGGADEWPKQFKELEDGEYIPYPPEGGYIEVTVYQGFYGYDYNDSTTWGNEEHWTANNTRKRFGWLLYKAPQIDIVRCSASVPEADAVEYEIRAMLDNGAEQAIDVDLSVGQPYFKEEKNYDGYPTEATPAAKGLLMDAASYRDASYRISQFTRSAQYAFSRGGVAGRLDTLLACALAAQYTHRRTVLSGEAYLDWQGLAVYTEQNQRWAVFNLTSEVQDLITDTAEIQLTELMPENTRVDSASVRVGSDGVINTMHLTDADALATEDYEYVVTEDELYLIAIRPKAGISYLITEDGYLVATESDNEIYIND